MWAHIGVQEGGRREIPYHKNKNMKVEEQIGGGE